MQELFCSSALSPWLAIRRIQKKARTKQKVLAMFLYQPILCIEMKQRTPKNTNKGRGISKLSPIPVRLEKAQSEQLKNLSSRSGVPVSVIMRCAIAWALPRFASKELSLLGDE
jgi:hypothetical protein